MPRSTTTSSEQAKALRIALRTAQQELEAERETVRRLAASDELTGLLNRSALLGRVDQALEHARSGERAVALLSLDLDGFRLVNDSLGHSAGDRLLTKVALRLESRRREQDVLARQGGDEFLLLLTDIPRASAHLAAQGAARGLLECLRAPFVVSGMEFQIGAAIGISIFGSDAHDADALMRHADAAMYQAKAAGPHEARVYNADRPEPLRRLSLSTRLRHAIAGEELVLHWQPIVDVRSGEIRALEALVRWQDPIRGLLGPGEFIPFAEEHGLIDEVGAHVFELLCRQRVAWRRAGFDPPLTFNVSARELRDPAFVERLMRSLERHGLDTAGLTAELTESTAMLDPSTTLPVLRALAATGIRIAIDDFGAGHSSLARIRRLPVGMLKIDRSLLTGAEDDPIAAEILRAIVGLGGNLGIDVVAEGVEEEVQRALLAELGCPLAQGFGLGRPVPAADLPGPLPVAA